MLSASAFAQARGPYINATAGGSLRPGVYGRIEFDKAPAPPVIHPQPVLAKGVPSRPGMVPVYLYVPPGYVRKWPRHCHKYDACDKPVYFVRMDDNPGKLGKWKQLAMQDSAPRRIAANSWSDEP